MKFLAIILTLLSFRSEANSCAADAKKFCVGVDPGKGQLSKCLSDYQESLSAACSKELKEYKANTAKKNPCFEDLADLCSNVPAENSNLELCLLKNETRLSPVCAKDFGKKKGNIIVKNVCAQDIVGHCYPQVSSEAGAINHCLIRNRAKLSGFCKKRTDEQVAKMIKENPCFESTEKLCPTHVKFIDIQECLEKKLDTLPQLCKKIVIHEVAKAKANPCYKDLSRHCVPNLPPKQQYECLTLNENHLSNSCRQYRVLESEKVNSMVNLCENDRQKLCANEPFENGMVVKCLRLNKAKLSKACAKLM
ncbi:MAG TPA: hypothetical protein VNJ08_08425 [Bacteriovoracaceae bacterium]|nr:hypothetical protein [Bacteriovoracaceae bacterium]